ncbi:MAG: Ig-like domain-containing protein, partial [Bacteroidota bacterium]
MIFKGSNNQSVTLNEDTPTAITLVATDADAGDVLSYSVVTAPTKGTLSCSNCSNPTYTPNANYFGADSFTFRVFDGAKFSNTATVSITVTSVNDKPVAANQSLTTQEDTPLTITLSATDIEASPLTYSVVAQPTNGTLTGTAPNLTYTPAANFFGSDSFTFKANDGTDDSNTATVSITVTAVNDAPVANNQSVTTLEDTPKVITLVATDAEGSPLTYSVVTAPTKGTFTISGATVTYTPTANLNGADSFTFKANDGTADSNTATVSITITPVNDAPVASSATVTLNEDSFAAVTLSAADVDSDPLTYTILTQPEHGLLTGTAPNLTYTPFANFWGTDSFTFKVNDGTVDSNTATISLVINPRADAPIVDNQSLTVDEDNQLDIILTGSDADDEAVTFIILTQPAHGTLTGTVPNITYTPNLNYNGPDSFTFQGFDGAAFSATGTISITVNPVNDTPVANPQSVTTDEDTAASITLIGSDVDLDVLTYSIVAQPTHGTLTGSGASVTYTPDADYNGLDSFTFKVNDGTVDSNTATVSITVKAVNDAPV